jgi:hypothetical protein
MEGYYFLACLLPPLPDVLGEKLSVSFPEITRMVRRNIEASDVPLVQAQLSVIDAANWECFDQGKDYFLEGGILTHEEIKARRNLPAFIRQFIAEKERDIRRRCIYDRLWELCYAAILSLAREAGCRYLMDYIPWEINLRNRLVAQRLRDSDGNLADSTVLPGSATFDFSSLLSQLDAQKNPLDAERLLDGERLKRMSSSSGSDPFSRDAILAFLAQAAIFSRWEFMQAPFDMDNFLLSGG